MKMKNTIKLSCLFAGVALGSACVDAPSAPSTTVAHASTAAPGRYIIKVDGEAGRAAVAEQATILRDLSRANAVAAVLPDSALIALQSNPHILSIEADAKRYLSSTAPTTSPYGLSAVQADQLSGGGIVKVCIIDSGLGAHHDALQHLTVTADEDPETCVRKGKGPVVDCSGTGDPFYDDNGHGTHVAGTIAGTINGVNIGVAPSNVALHIVKVFTAEGWAYSSDLAHAADLCAAAGAKVINMSLGGPTAISAERDTFASLYADGILSIAAAGNDGNTSHSYPASYDAVVSVAAIDEGLVVADFSQQTDQVELAAPGVSVLSSSPYNEDARVTVNATDTEGLGIEFAALGSATGDLVSAGLCETADMADFTGKVVHCRRGVISFFDKVANAESNGAAAVIISNNEAGELLATLGAGNSSAVPAIGVNQAAGDTLDGLTGSSATVTNLSEFPASGYVAWNGTSMATPHVVGVAALIWSNHPTASAADVRSALTSTAFDLGAPGRDNAYGYGLVQAFDANAAFPEPCVPTSADELVCDDGIDNDCDGDVDGADLDCCVATESPEATCGDGVDNDCNGFTDLDDASCEPVVPQCELGASGDACGSGADCCSGKCKGGACRGN